MRLNNACPEAGCPEEGKAKPGYFAESGPGQPVKNV